ncbi:MAG: MCE family protein [Mycobacteriales bacterium]
MTSPSQRVVAPLVKLIIFAVVTIILTALLASTISPFGFGGRAKYHAVFTDVTGLLPGDDIRISGVKVGKVDKIGITQRRYARVTFEIDSGIDLGAGTHAIVRYRNLVGQRYVALTDGPGSGPPLRHGATIPLSRTRPALDLTVLFNGFRPLFDALRPDDINKLSYALVTTLQGEGGTVSTLLAQTASLTSTLADRDQLIGQVIDNLNVVVGTVAEHSKQLDTLVVNLQQLVSGLAADRTSIGDSLSSINDLAGATQDLLSRARPSLAADIDQLKLLTGNLGTPQNTQRIDQYLQELPGKINEITRTATTGSWFNFYLCDFNGQVIIPAGKTINFKSYQGRCS